MKKISLLPLWMILLSVLIGIYPVQATEFNIKARAAVLMDPESGRVLFEQNAHQKLPPASVTKLMTMLLVMEAVDTGRVK
ncbi:MAG TPA: serine hydrolase, partial [Bacillota bacterium]|nr:serine hydrolase [Bacillota bacterium]